MARSHLAMPICPTCEAFFPTILGLTNHTKTECSRWTKSQSFEIVMLQCDGTKNKFGGCDLPIEAIAKLAKSCFKSLKDDSVFKMLLAPEFFFWNDLGSPKGAFSSKEVSQCFSTMAKVSAGVGKVLLVPGTVPVADSFAFQDLKTHYKHLEGVKIMNKELLPEGVAREYLNEEWTGQLEYTSKAKKAFSYRNVLGGFYDGRKIIEYHKQIPYTSSSDFEYHWFLDEDAMVMGLPPIENRRSSVVVGGVKLGFEICAEHQYGTLMAFGDGPPDVHILLANSMEEYFDQLVYTPPAGGLFAHVDAKEEHCQLYYAKDGKLALVKPKETLVLKEKGFSGTILYYEEKLRIPVRFV